MFLILLIVLGLGVIAILITDGDESVQSIDSRSAQIGGSTSTTTSTTVRPTTTTRPAVTTTPTTAAPSTTTSQPSRQVNNTPPAQHSVEQATPVVVSADPPPPAAPQCDPVPTSRPNPDTVRSGGLTSTHCDLTVTPTSDCYEAGVIVRLNVHGFQPGQQYDATAWYPNGTHYTLDLGNTATVNADGSLPWKWTCETKDQPPPGPAVPYVVLLVVPSTNQWITFKVMVAPAP